MVYYDVMVVNIDVVVIYTLEPLEIMTTSKNSNSKARANTELSVTGSCLSSFPILQSLSTISCLFLRVTTEDPLVTTTTKVLYLAKLVLELSELVLTIKVVRPKSSSSSNSCILLIVTSSIASIT